ncbi:hypothetical protein [Paraburkholderia phenoliruptrix]|nr:hypothetical protein [Paraburkholderia phenoliruptrix]
MYDDLRFDYRMPDGYDGEEYQTKALNCTLDVYMVSCDGRLLRSECAGHRDDDGNTQRLIGDLCFDGTLNVYHRDTFGGTGWHEYDLIFQQGNLVEIRCHQTRSRLAFAPVIASFRPKQTTENAIMNNETKARLRPILANGRRGKPEYSP